MGEYRGVLRGIGDRHDRFQTRFRFGGTAAALAIDAEPLLDRTGTMQAETLFLVRRRYSRDGAAPLVAPLGRRITAAAAAARSPAERPYRRARHVVTENVRVLAAAVLAAGDLMAMGALMAASHRSMRDYFEISVPPIDRLVDLIDGVIAGEGGARMTGGGFGGCVVALIGEDAVASVTRAVAAHYRTPEGAAAPVFISLPSAAARQIAFPGAHGSAA